ncbi:MAG: MotA/TolQ/ExbB proton channel family protein [Treponema sp.]|nr:MotA/TolQ/ExbB proton channel family protein [Treponema sp.]
MLQTLKSGGILMIPIIICGILSCYIIIERCIYFFSVRQRDKLLVRDITDCLSVGDYERCASQCASADTPLAQVVLRALDCRHYDERDLRDMVEAEMDLAIPKFEHLLTPLGTIANIATLLGLLGTVTGNIKAFGVLGAGGSMGDPALLAASIAEALVTTVAGLCVSIPALIFHNFFVSRVNKRIVEMEAQITTVVLKLSGRVR